MIGRADIEGSKSNVAMNAWLPRFHDVPPQQNSPPDNDRGHDNVLRPERPAEASLGSKRRGCYPSDSRNGFPLSVPVMSWLFVTRGNIPKESFLVRPPADTRWSARTKLAAQAAR
ncbi:unnamed protein product [Brassica rapa subsp. narinosa]